MSADHKKSEERELDALFVAAQAEPLPTPSEALLGRIAADAVAWQPPNDTAKLPSLIAQIVDAIGGWPAIGGLATATVAGVYIGFVQPDLVTIGTADNAATEIGMADVFPDDTLFFEEG